MGAVVEVKYFNSFVLRKTLTGQLQPIWNGSFGIPSDLNGGFPVTAENTDQPDNWAIEEARIRGGYNNTSTSYGAKAYLVEEEPNAFVRFNAMIYSGIFNSRTGINDTNVFSVGKDISKATDPANGSIQRLYAEDTNLYIFQENKVSRALIDKDAVYSAEGQGAITSSNLVIGVIQPIPGKYGISQNPESFAVYGYDKYFSDKNNNVILKLSNSGIIEISNTGMRDYFRDELNSLDLGGTPGFVRGGWDLYNGQYVISTQQNTVYKGSDVTYNTLSFEPLVQGWTSFYSYLPDQMFSVRNNFYSTKGDKLYKHYSTGVNRGSFYGVNNSSNVTAVFNPEPTRSKSFKTISYEGSNGWYVESMLSDQTGQNPSVTPSGQWLNATDSGLEILSYLGGEYVEPTANGQTVAASAIATVTLLIGGVTSYSLTAAGTGYTAATGVATTVAPAGGTGLTVDTTVVNGAITHVVINAVGSGYSVGDVVTITGGGGNATFTITSIQSTTGAIPAGAIVSGIGVSTGTTVVSYNTTTGLLTCNQALDVAAEATLDFTGTVPRASYNASLGTTNPGWPRYHSGFNRKENKYVADIINNTTLTMIPGEVIFGSDISGLKGFYLTTKVSTDNITNVGAEKQLFSVATNYDINNGY